MYCRGLCVFFFFKQKTAYEMRISDWSSDVCSSDLGTESVSVANSGEVVGNVNLGGGDNILSNAAGGTIAGNIITGNGANTISNEGGPITGGIVAGRGADTLRHAGTITGDVEMGAGADTPTVGPGGSCGGKGTTGEGLGVRGLT